MLQRFEQLLAFIAALACCLLVGVIGSAAEQPVAPEFTHSQSADWINSEPITLQSLRGKVVLLDFWTFACWNCYRSFPWLNGFEKKFGSTGLQVVGIHTPEFDRERVRSSIEAKVKEFHLSHPIMIDNDYSYWKAMGNRYWPAYYLIDKTGKVRGSFYGETHPGTKQAEAIAVLAQSLLDEKY